MWSGFRVSKPGPLLDMNPYPISLYTSGYVSLSHWWKARLKALRRAEPNVLWLLVMSPSALTVNSRALMSLIPPTPQKTLMSWSRHSTTVSPEEVPL